MVRNFRIAGTAIATLAAMAACQKGVGSKTDTAPVAVQTPDVASGSGVDTTSTSGSDGSSSGSGTETTGIDATKTFVVSGQLALTLGLADAPHITHVVALNTETGDSIAVPVDQKTGKFELPLGIDQGGGSGSGSSHDFKKYIGADGSLDRTTMLKEHPEVAADIAGKSDADVIAMINESGSGSGSGSGSASAAAPHEASPWTLAYVDATKKGTEMLVSRFAAETLDTLSPAAAAGSLALGDITPVAGDKAKSTTDYADILKGTGMSTATATAFGAIDDVCLRYINPDINGDGKLDATVLDADGKVLSGQRRFTIDFHNRFNLKEKGGNNIDHKSLKNKFVDEVITGGLTNLEVSFTGTGIMPEMDKTDFKSAPKSYKWKFDAPVDLNNGAACTEDATLTTLPASTFCTKAFTENVNYPRYQLGMEVKMPPEGTYVLETDDGQVFTWTDVKVSDFSAGVGMLVLLVKYNVDDKGNADPADDVLTGVDFKYIRKSDAGWVAATPEELKLIIKGDGGYVSMHLEDWSMEVGFSVPKMPLGHLELKDIHVNYSSTVDQATQNAITGGQGVLWSRFQGAGVSYDDKMGMRFFF